MNKANKPTTITAPFFFITFVTLKLLNHRTKGTVIVTAYLYYAPLYTLIKQILQYRLQIAVFHIFKNIFRRSFTNQIVVNVRFYYYVCYINFLEIHIVFFYLLKHKQGLSQD